MEDNKYVERYRELDALRGIAALMVVLFHYSLLQIGTTGVDLFFVISGFVILMSVSKIKSSKEFIINRVSRLYPTYWFCVTFTFVCKLCYYGLVDKNAIDNKLLVQYIANMSMFQMYFDIRNLDGPYWTMIIEMLFYVLILVLFRFSLLKYLQAVGLVLSLLCVVFIRNFNSTFTEALYEWVPLLQFFPLFFAGILLYKIRTIKGNNALKYSLFVVCFICQVILFNYAGRSKYYIDQIEYAIILFVYFGLFALFVNGKLGFIVSKCTLFLGKISYALYLSHQFISLVIIIPFLTNKLHINTVIASLFIALPIVILLATFITYYIELPMSKLMKEKLGKLFLPEH
jgi:peptidoglycan/LPS O-acetylase OafA/YrhL